MKALILVKWAALGLIFGSMMVACGDKDDNKRASASQYVEINNVCYERDDEREVHRSRCNDENSPRYYTQNNRCYDYETDDRVDDSNCDPVFRNRNGYNGYNGYNNGYNNPSRIRCDIVYDPYTYQPVDCSRQYCSGYLFLDRNGTPVECL